MLSGDNAILNTRNESRDHEVVGLQTPVCLKLLFGVKTRFQNHVD